MDAMQPSSSLELGLNVSGRARRDTGPEAFIAKSLSESPTGEIRLMESILERENMRRALHRVRKNDGAPGIDGRTVDELPRYLRRHWETIWIPTRQIPAHGHSQSTELYQGWLSMGGGP